MAVGAEGARRRARFVGGDSPLAALTETRRDLVIVLDGSASTNYREGVRSVHERILERARELLGELEGESDHRVRLLWAAGWWPLGDRAYACAVGAWAAWLFPRSEFANGNTLIFVVPIFGGVALDVMRERGLGAEAEARGALVLMLSVLVILATAPVGAIGIAAAGPRWLEREVPKVVGEAVSATEAPADEEEEAAAPNGSV